MTLFLYGMEINNQRYKQNLPIDLLQQLSIWLLFQYRRWQSKVPQTMDETPVTAVKTLVCREAAVEGQTPVVLRKIAYRRIAWDRVRRETRSYF